MEEHKNNGRAILGIVLIFIGLALVAGYFHLLPGGWRSVLFTWQALLILIGLLLLLAKNKLPGIILICVGAFFLIPEFWSVPHGWGKLFWPAILIIIGLFILSRGFRRPVSIGDISSDYIDDMDIFGGGDRMISSQNFKGGRYTAIFGGSKYNLTRASLAKGRSYLDIFTMFGGVKLIIPSSWDVKVEINSIFGGFSDKRTVPHDEIRDPSKELVIKGTALFGGGDIESF